MNYCPNCGKPIETSGKYCPYCGKAFSSGKKKGIVFAIVLIIALFLCLLAVIWYKYHHEPNIEQSAAAPSPSEAIHKKTFSDDSEGISEASNSVVLLSGYNKHGELCVTGSGFAVFDEGVIVTNIHVINSGVVRITAQTEAGSEFTCSNIIGFNSDKDIAILKSDTETGLNLLKVGHSSSLQKGDKVVAIGSPLGLLNSVSTGVFSGYINDGDDTVLQFTASISPGSSGGALFNDAGEVIGITFASFSEGQNLNLAIPIEEAEDLYNRTAGKIQAMSIQRFYDEIYRASINANIGMDYESFVEQIQFFNDLSFRKNQ